MVCRVHLAAPSGGVSGVFHQNRVEKGLGGTSHDDQTHHGDSGLRLTNGFNVRFDSLSNGILPETALDNPFVRWNETIE